MYHCEQDIEHYVEDLMKKNSELQRVTKKKDKVDEDFREKKKEQGRHQREYSKIEQQIREAVSQCSFLLYEVLSCNISAVHTIRLFRKLN